MSWSAVSLALSLTVSPPLQLDNKDERVWKQIKPSVLFLVEGGEPRGTAALIDRAGLFLAHRSALRPNSAIVGRMGSGETVNLTLKATDSLTGLVLLQAKSWKSKAAPLLPGTRGPKPNQRLLTVLGSGPIRAEYITGNRVGVDSETRRMIPLSEIRFESRSEAVGGALLVTLDGKLTGFLSATLDQSTAGGGGAALPAGLGIAPQNQEEPNFGPGGMTVGYSIAPEVVQRVVLAFRKPPYVVQHPSLGVFCRNAVKPPGALVVRVRPGSPAQRYGIRVNDVILSMGGKPVKSQLDFARVMMNQKVGSSLKIKLSRGGTQVLMTVVVGARP